MPHVCDLIAVLSPLKSWPDNVRLARDACSLVQGLSWVETHDLDDLRVMGKRREAAALALNGQGVNGLKVSCFAANIRGDLSRVTIDRHMLTAAGFEPNNTSAWARGACQEWVRETAHDQRANPHGFWPAELQAVIWAEERRRKGHK